MWEAGVGSCIAALGPWLLAGGEQLASSKQMRSRWELVIGLTLRLRRPQEARHPQCSGTGLVPVPCSSLGANCLTIGGGSCRQEAYDRVRSVYVASTPPQGRRGSPPRVIRHALKSETVLSGSLLAIGARIDALDIPRHLYSADLIAQGFVTGQAEAFGVQKLSDLAVSSEELRFQSSMLRRIV